MMNVLGKRWLSMGWRVMDSADSEAMALVWIETLDEEKIPFKHYGELYRRAVRLRSDRLERGLKCDDFSVEMMIVCWRELSREIEQRMRESGRYLPDTAASDCPRCYGAGMECVPGKGARPCTHEPLDPGEIETQTAKTESPEPIVEIPKRERPRPKSAIGIFNQAKLDGGDREMLSRMIEREK